MNILVLNWRDMKHPEAGGAEVHFMEIFKRLVGKGHGVTLLTTRFKGSTPEDVQDGIRVCRFGHTYTFNWEAPFLIRSLMRTTKIDCIIDDVNKIPFFTPRWFPSVKCGVFFHHLFGQTIFSLAARPMADYVLFLENMSGWGYRHVPCCTVSKSTASELANKGFDPRNISIIENSVDTDMYTPDPSIQKENDLLLYTGRLKRYKSLDILFDAVKRLSDEGMALRVIIAGSGDDEGYLKSYASKLGIGEKIRFLGYIDETMKIDLYRKAAIFINPSRKEGWGITSIEANACGTAVIANDAPGLRDSVRHEETGLLYKENDPVSLAGCIRQVIDDQRKRSLFEQQGRRWALRFSWDRSAEKVEQWLNQILSAKR